MITRLTLIVFCALLAGCLSAEGIKRNQWSKSEVVAWYAKYEPVVHGLSKYCYAGSNAKYHYFICRPIDSFLIQKIPRAELVMPDERKREDLGKRLYFYQVDPKRNFKKMPAESGEMKGVRPKFNAIQD